MAYSRQHTINEVGYRVGQGGRYAGLMLGKTFLKGMTAIGSIMAGISGSLTSVAISGTIGMAAGIGMQAYLNHKEYEHSLSQLATLYRKEIGAKLGKDYHYVSVQDLEKITETNPTLNKQVELEKKRRDVKTGVAAAVGLVGFAVVAATFATAGFAAALPLGLITPFIAKPIIKPIAERMFNVHEKTPIDLIKDLERSRTRARSVSKSQVMEVFVASSPKLQEAIEKEFNKPFAKLALSDKEKIMHQYGEMIKLEQTTRAINDYSMNPRELTFIIHGQRSGAYADASYKDQFNETIGQVKEKAKGIQQNISQARRKTLGRISNLMGRSSAENAHDDTAPTGPAHTENGWQKYEDMRRSQATPMQPQRG